MPNQVTALLCREYIWYRSQYPQSETRSVLHELVMQAFDLEGIDYQRDRETAAEIAAEIAGQDAAAKSGLDKINDADV